MKRFFSLVGFGLSLSVLAVVAAAGEIPAAPPAPPATQPAATVTQGQIFNLGGRTATVQKVDMLPYVEDDYTRLFTFDRFENPKLKELREKYKLDEVVSAGKTEFDKQILLMAWAKSQFPFGSPPPGMDGLRNAQEILKEAGKPGVHFFCTQYASVLISAAQALGWPARHMIIPQHTFVEVWSNQHRKWVMLDPTASAYAEKDAVPLNTFEIRYEWYRREGKELTWVVCKPGLPVERLGAAGSGKPPLSVDRYYALGYVPNGDLMDSPPDWTKMIVVKDDLGAGKPKFHMRPMPANPAVDQYFPLNQATIGLSPDGQDMQAALRTLTPNFKEFRICFDGGLWQVAGETVAWKLRPGVNRLQARSVNKFGVAGPVSTLDLAVDK